MVLAILVPMAPEPARNSHWLKRKPDGIKCHFLPKIATNPTVARERGTVAGRDQKCTYAPVDPYNILEYQKDRPNGCTPIPVTSFSHYVKFEFPAERLIFRV